MSTLFQQASEHVKSLHKNETWKIEFDTKHGGITALVSVLYAVNVKIPLVLSCLFTSNSAKTVRLSSVKLPMITSVLMFTCSVINVNLYI
jgi:hypothetical protein